MSIKPFAKITVTELVMKSGVSRTSFYRSYKTKEDVISEILEELGTRLNNTAKADSEEWFVNFFNEIRSCQKEISLILNSDIPKDIVIGFFLPSSNNDDPSAAPEKIYSEAAKEWAFYGIVSRWFSSGLKESSEYMAKLCKALLPALNENDTPRKLS